MSSAESPDIVLSPFTSLHFVGSIPLHSTERTLKRLATSVPPPFIRRLPDGEPRKWQTFVIFQRAVFADCSFVLRPTDLSPNPVPEPVPSFPPVLRLRSVEYDEHAISSYKTFCKLRSQNIIPEGVRFQVSLPTSANVIGVLVEKAWRSLVEPLYVASLLAALRRIQDEIPREDLAFQWDLAAEFSMLEDVNAEPMQWFDEPLMDGLVRHVFALAEAVELGFHLCYGDLGHRHFVEPKDTALLVEVGNNLLKGVIRRIDWIHMTVPRARSDRECFQPLTELELGETELVLGLLHMDDEKGTRARIETARDAVSRFGVATECGLGRASMTELESILSIARSVMTPKG